MSEDSMKESLLITRGSSFLRCVNNLLEILKVYFSIERKVRLKRKEFKDRDRIVSFDDISLFVG